MFLISCQTVTDTQADEGGLIRCLQRGSVMASISSEMRILLNKCAFIKEVPEDENC